MWSAGGRASIPAAARPLSEVQRRPTSGAGPPWEKRRQRAQCIPHLSVLACASACTTACGNVHTASSQRRRRRLILTVALSLCLVLAAWPMHREFEVHSLVSGKGRPIRRDSYADIEAGDGICRERSTAGPPWEKVVFRIAHVCTP